MEVLGIEVPRSIVPLLNDFKTNPFAIRRGLSARLRQ